MIDFLKIIFGLLFFAIMPFLGLAFIYFCYSRALVSDDPKRTFGIACRYGAGAGITWSLLISFLSSALMFATSLLDTEFNLQSAILFAFLVLCSAIYPIALIQTYKLGMNLSKKLPEKINQDYVHKELAVIIIFSAIMAAIGIYVILQGFFF